MIHKYKYIAKVIKVVDGDTVDMEVDLGFGVKRLDRFRILELDTFETRMVRGTTLEDRNKGLEAKRFARKLLLDQYVVIETHKDKKGKYGRYLCSILLPTGLDYATLMKEEGYEKSN